MLEPTASRRIIIEDASGQVMPKSNAGNFPGHGNHHGSTAGVQRMGRESRIPTGFPSPAFASTAEIDPKICGNLRNLWPIHRLTPRSHP